MKTTVSLILIFLLVLGGCKSSKITSSWKAANAIEKQYAKVLVLGLIPDKDNLLLEKMENHLAADLQKLGYTTISAMTLYGPQAFRNLTEQEAIAKLKGSNIDAVVTIVLLNKKVEKQFVPMEPRLLTDVNTQNQFWEYYDAVNKRIIQPGYYFENTEYYWESNLYTLANHQLAYSAQTQTFNPNNAEKLGHEYGLMIVKDMVKKKVLNKQTPLPLKGF